VLLGYGGKSDYEYGFGSYAVAFHYPHIANRYVGRNDGIIVVDYGAYALLVFNFSAVCIREKQREGFILFDLRVAVNCNRDVLRRRAGCKSDDAFVGGIIIVGDGRSAVGG